MRHEEEASEKRLWRRGNKGQDEAEKKRRRMGHREETNETGLPKRSDRENAVEKRQWRRSREEEAETAVK